MVNSYYFYSTGVCTNTVRQDRGTFAFPFAFVSVRNSNRWIAEVAARSCTGYRLFHTVGFERAVFLHTVVASVACLYTVFRGSQETSSHGTWLIRSTHIPKASTVSSRIFVFAFVGLPRSTNIPFVAKYSQQITDIFAFLPTPSIPEEAHVVVIVGKANFLFCTLVQLQYYCKIKVGGVGTG